MRSRMLNFMPPSLHSSVRCAGVHKSVVCAKGGKVKDKDKTWDAAKKALLSDVKSFLDALLDFKNQVDANAVPSGNWADVREYLALPYFNVEAIKVRGVYGVQQAW